MEVFGLINIPLTIILVIVVIICFYLYETWTFSKWTELGIPGPKPTIFRGTFQSKYMDLYAAFREWKERYGHTFGVFFSRLPFLVTSDRDIFKEIMVKQFSKFSHHSHSVFDDVMTDFERKMLFMSNGIPWKRYRHAMTPAFTTGKLKALQSYLVRCSHSLVTVLRDKATKDEDVDLKHVYGCFTMDVIAGTGFGLDTNLQSGDGAGHHDMLNAMKNLFNNINSSSPVYLLAAFPFLAPVMRLMGYSMMPQKNVNFFRGCLETLIKERDANPAEAQHRVDFLQQMMNIRVDGGQKSEELDAEVTDTSVPKKLTEEEVVAEGIQVFLAAYETTANTLRFVAHNLALHPDVQEKLHQEVQAVVGQGDILYEHLSQLKYMDCVIHETLRMFPVVPNISRKAVETVTIKDITIPKGTGIIIPVYTIMHDPEIFPDPEKFDPDRCLDMDDTLLMTLPFGLGPRQCIGMRLAMQEMKTALAYVTRAVKFVPCEKTPKTINFLPGGMLVPKEEMIVRAETRN